MIRQCLLTMFSSAFTFEKRHIMKLDSCDRNLFKYLIYNQLNNLCCKCLLSACWN